MKASDDLATSIGWHTENFGRAGKGLKALAHYLKPQLSPEQQREQGALELRQMFQRMKQKQEAASGAR